MNFVFALDLHSKELSAQPVVQTIIVAGVRNQTSPSNGFF
jgi:hypothetical protein